MKSVVILNSVICLGVLWSGYGFTSPSSLKINSIDFVLQQAVSGTVLDENGQPLPGVTILVKNSKVGTITGFDGAFSIVIPTDSPEKILVFSFIGYATRELPYNSPELRAVKMSQEGDILDEVVVTAYGTVKKQNLTDALVSIDAEKVISDRPLRSVADALAGIAPGLNVRVTSGAPEATPSINIRGFTGFNSVNAPLVLVDGIERPIQDVNPNDVESVSVLKDGASTAVYGSRAPYGIILITTKQGKSGKVNISYTSNYRFGDFGIFPTKLNSYQWADYINQLLLSDPKGTGAPVFSSLQIDRMKAWANGDFKNPVFDGLDEKYVRNGSYPIGNTGYGFFEPFANDDFKSAYFRKNSFSSQQNLSFSGGTDKVTYYSSLGYNSNQSQIQGPNYTDRYNFNTKLNFKATDWLELTTNVSYVRQSQQSPNYRDNGIKYDDLFSTYGREYFNVPIRNPDNPKFYHAEVSVGTATGEGGLVTGIRNDLTLQNGFKIKPLKGLVIEGEYTWRTYGYADTKTTLVVNQYLPDGEIIAGNRTATNSGVGKTIENTDYQFAKTQISYTRVIADDHHLYAQLGTQLENNNYQNLYGFGQNLYAPTVLQTISTTSGPFRARDVLYHWGTFGFYGVFTYDYKEKYLLKVAARRDASSRFSTKSRWGTFPSISVGWNIGKEAFFEPLTKWVTTLKPRASYSSSGDLASVDGYYPYIPTLGGSISDKNILGGNLAQQINGAPGLVSQSLTWAKPVVLDLGIDITALQNRLTLSYDWYQRTVYDQISPPNPLPAVLGTSAPNLNNAVSETRGWDLKVGWQDQFMLLRKPLSYSINFVMSDYIGYVVSYGENVVGSRDANVWTKGQIFGQNFMYQAVGVAQNRADLGRQVLPGAYNYPGRLLYKDLNGDGYINGGTGNVWSALGDLKENGFSYPRKSYSISPSIDWNGIHLSAIFEGVMQWTQFVSGPYVFGTNGNQWFSPFYKESTDLGYWTPKNTSAFFPAVGNSTNTANDKYALNLAHLRIRNITLGYNLPQHWLQKVRLSKVYLYLSGENLGFVYNAAFIKYDPDFLSNGSYPPMKYYSFGINVNL